MKVKRNTMPEPGHTGFHDLGSNGNPITGAIYLAVAVSVGLFFFGMLAYVLVLIALD